jgi:hypothetical protein
MDGSGRDARAASFHRLTLHALDGREWRAEEHDVFHCLLALRAQVEPLGLQLCCNGARRDAWTSGMLGDMWQGKIVYLLGEAKPGERPPMAPTLGPAPATSVSSVQEQRAFHEAWLLRPR